jgi:hypothetical protein
MTAIGKKLPDPAPGDIEALLPWHAAGTLSTRDSRRVDEALARHPELARQHAAIREECAEIIRLNDSLGAPSSRAMHKLFAAIDAEPLRDSHASFNISRRAADFFVRLSPRTLATIAAFAAVALLLQAGAIGALLMNRDGGSLQAISFARNARPGIDSGVYALVRFAPDARVSEIAIFLQTYHASLVDAGKGGLFRLQIGDGAMSRDEVAALMGRLQTEKVISLAAAAP